MPQAQRLDLNALASTAGLSAMLSSAGSLGDLLRAVVYTLAAPKLQFEAVNKTVAAYLNLLEAKRRLMRARVAEAKEEAQAQAKDVANALEEEKRQEQAVREAEERLAQAAASHQSLASVNHWLPKAVEPARPLAEACEKLARAFEQAKTSLVEGLATLGLPEAEHETIIAEMREAAEAYIASCALGEPITEPAPANTSSTESHHVIRGLTSAPMHHALQPEQRHQGELLDLMLQIMARRLLSAQSRVLMDDVAENGQSLGLADTVSRLRTHALARQLFNQVTQLAIISASAASESRSAAPLMRQAEDIAHSYSNPFERSSDPSTSMRRPVPHSR